MRRPRRAETFGAGLLATSVVAASFIAAAPAMADDVVVSNNFEDGVIEPWEARGGTDLTIADDDASGEGTQSLLVSNRTDSWHGIETDALSVFLVPGEEYTISAQVKLGADATAASEANFTVQVTEDATDTYDRVGDAVPVDSEAWVEVGGTYTLAEGADSALLYLEAAVIGEDEHPSVLVDDIRITGPTGPSTELPLTHAFEEGLGAWQARGDGAATVSLTDAEAHSGEQSAQVTGRTDTWNGIGADVTDLFVTGTPYTITGWVKFPADSGETDDVRLSIERQHDDADTNYDTLTTAEGVGDTEWVQVSTTYTMTDADSALVYFETANGTADFLLDDVVVTSPQQSVQLDIPDLHGEVPWPLGVAIDERETVGAPAQLVTKHFNQITAENHMKPEAIQPEEGVFTFAAADQLVDFALANDMKVYGHTLVWHSQTPDWFFQDADGNPLTDSPAHQELLRERMRTHIFTVADHFRDKYGEYGTEGNPITAFDVVNEAIAESEDDGLRRSPWYNVLGEEYLDLAFQYAHEAFGDDVLLVLNDYNTELPAKRQAMIDVASRMLDRGAHLTGLGHQFHVSLAQPVSQMRASIEAFAELGLPQAVTELDVVIPGAITAERLVDQGYYYADVFDMLRDYDLFAVTVWGPYDSRSWRSEGAPLVFDDYLQAKWAYWGVVDPTQLPAPTNNLNVHEAAVPADESGLTALDWDLLPLEEISADGATGFQARWSPDSGVTVYVEVADETDDGAADVVELFAGGDVITVPRDGSGTATAATTETDEGYAVVVHVPVDGPAEGDAVPFDIRVTDGATGDQVSWNDPTHGQEDGERLGTLTLVEPLGFAQVPQASTEPVVDGAVDDVWAEAVTVRTDVTIEGSEDGARADVHLLWTPDRLHLLFEVADDELDESNSNAWEQDSVEVFLDPDNAKAGPFRDVDGQYRVSFSGAQSISGELSVIGDNLTSATEVTDDGYRVEMSLELGRTAEPGELVGVDLQVNDAAGGTRQAVHIWSDPTGRSYQDTSRWGVVQLVAGDAGPVVPTDPESAIAMLAESLEAYVAAGDVAGPIAHQLANALDQAQRHVAGDRVRPAVVAIERFVRHLDHPKRPDHLTEDARADLRARAMVVLDLLH